MDILINKSGTFYKIENKEVATIITSAYQDIELLVRDIVNISVSSSVKQDYRIGDMIVVGGRLYKMNRPAKEKKSGQYSFAYDMEFEGVQYDLARATYDLTINTTNNQLQDVQANSLTGNLSRFAQVLIANANRVFPGMWQLGEVPETSSDKTLTFNDGDNCLAVLQTLCKEYETEFEIAYSAGVFIIHLKKIGRALPYSFRYGRGRGLYSLERQNVSSANLVTRLKVYGAAKNITTKYRSNRLCLPTKTKGESYIEQHDVISKYGVWENAATFDDIYPRRTGRITALGSSIYKFVDSTMFDLNVKEADGITTKYLLSGIKPKARFNSGKLAGYEFYINYDHPTRTFTVTKIVDDRGAEFPKSESSEFQFSIGDEYILLDIALPDEYIAAAEAELLKKGLEKYDTVSQPNVQYNLKIDENYIRKIAENVNEFDLILPGDTLKVEDEDIGISKAIKVKSIKRNLIKDYEYEVVLSDVAEVSIATRVLSDIKDISKVISENNLKQYQNPLDKTSLHALRADFADEANHALLADRATYAEDSDKWDGCQFADYINQPVRTGDSVAFQGVKAVTALHIPQVNHNDVNALYKAGPYLMLGTSKAHAGNADLWNNLAQPGYLTQPVRPEDSVRFAGLYVANDAGSQAFASGFAGHGWRVNATGDAEFDNLTVRKGLNVYTLNIREITGTGGSFAVTNVGKWKSVVKSGSFYVCEIDTDSGTIFNPFRTGDLLRCQIWDSSRVKYYIGQVITATADKVMLTIIDGTGIPETGDKVFQFGNITDTGRQGLLYMTNSDSNAPYLDVLDGVTGADLTGKTKVRLGRLDGITSPVWGVLNGYGLYAQNAYLENAFLSGVVRITGSGGNVPTISEAQGYASAAEANAKVSAKEYVDAVEIGGENLIRYSNKSNSQRPSNYLSLINAVSADFTTNNPTGDSLIKGGFHLPATNQQAYIADRNIVMESDTMYAFSFYTWKNNNTPVKYGLLPHAQTDFALNAAGTSINGAQLQYIIDNGGSALVKQVAAGVYRISVVFKLLNNNGNGIQITRQQLPDGSYAGGNTGMYFTGFKLEKATKASGFSLNILDISEDIDTAKNAAISASNAHANTVAEQKRIEAQAYADGKITQAEQRAIADATGRANAAKAYADAQDAALKTQVNAYADGKITALESNLIQSSNDNLAAAKLYAEAQSNAAKVAAQAYADGEIDKEEAARIKQADNYLAAAKAYAGAQDALLKTQQQAYADGKVSAAEAAAIAASKAYADLKKTEANSYADGKVSAEEARAIADAQAKFNAAKAYADAQDAALKTQVNAYADGKITASEAKSIKAANDSLAAAKAYSDAQDILLKTKTDAYTDGKVTEEERARIADAEAKLAAAKLHAEQKAREAEQAAKSAAADMDANIKVGGRNLLKGSKLPPVTTGTGMTVVTNADGTYSFKGSNGSQHAAYINRLLSPLEAGSEYTISIRYKIVGTASSPFLWYLNNGNSYVNIFTELTPDVWNICTATRILQTNTVVQFHIKVPNAQEVVIDWIKLEQGNKATDWTPAPEDVAADIDAAKAAAIARAEAIKTEINNVVSGVSTDLTAFKNSLDPIASDGIINIAKQGETFAQGGFLRNNAVFTNWVNAQVINADLIRAINDRGTGTLNTNRLNIQSIITTGNIATGNDISSTKAYADAVSNAVKTASNAYADGKITQAEARALADANAKLAEAKTHAATLDAALKIGGRNLIHGGFANGFWWQSSIGSTVTGQNGRTNNIIDLIVGEEYTFSMQKGSRINNNGLWITFRNANNTYHSVLIKSTQPFTFVAPAPKCTISGDFSLYTSVSGGKAFADLKPKLEIGNKATDWTPAPEDVQGEIDGIQIGGVNLLPNSTFKNGAHIALGANRTGTRETGVFEGKQALHMAGSGAGIGFYSLANGKFIAPGFDIAQYGGTTIAFSFDLYPVKPVINYRIIRAENTGILDDLDESKIPATGRWNRVSYLQKNIASPGRVQIVIYTGDADNDFYITNVMIEAGTRSSTHSLAPEDIATQIEAVRTETTTQFNVANGKIEGLISTTTSQGSRLSTAESRITQNAADITQRVSSSTFEAFKTSNTSAINTAKTDAINAANSATDGKISPITQRLTNAESSITQNANNIALKVSTTIFDTFKTSNANAINTAKTEAINTAANDATTKSSNAETNSKGYTDGKITPVNTALSSLTSRVTTTETSITQLSNSISLKAEQRVVDALTTTVNGKADSSAVTALTTRMNSAEAKITPDAINLAVKEQVDTKMSIAAGKTKVTVDATALDENKYYPVVINISGISRVRITVERVLGLPYGKPSYSTHELGFSIRCVWSAAAYGWGTQPINRNIEDYGSAFTDSTPVIGSISQAGNSSEEFIYVRGGSKYDVTVEGKVNADISLKAANYTTVRNQQINIANSISIPEVSTPTKTELRSEFTITPGGISMLGKTISLNGMVTFNALDSSAQGVINSKVSDTDFNTFKTSNANAINTAKTEAINTAANDASTKANAARTDAERAAKSYADAQDALRKTESTAYADGKVTAEEQRAVEDARAKLAEAKLHAEQKATAAEQAAKSAAALDATAKANSAYARATEEQKYVDGRRTTNETPLWYWVNYPKQIVREFKSCPSIGLPEGGVWCGLETIVRYQDSSGGAITQNAYTNNGTFRRQSNGKTAWTIWLKLTDTNDLSALQTNINNTYDYLRTALPTQISGGVILSTMIAARDNNNVIQSFQSGAGPIAFAAGVNGNLNSPKIALRHDGSGQLAGGNISWDVNGNTIITGTINATSSVFSGTVYANAGKIGGFKIDGAALTNDFETDDAYIIFRYDPAKIFAGIGTNVLSSTVGVRAAARFENEDMSNKWGGGRNIALYVSAKNSGMNDAIMIAGGWISGFAVNTKQITYDTVLTNEHCYVTTYNTATINVTLPANPQPGKVIHIRCMNPNYVIARGNGVNIHTKDGNIGQVYTMGKLNWRAGLHTFVYDGQYWCFNYQDT